MFSKEDCSFAAYKGLLRAVKDTGKYCDYADVVAENRDKFLVLRHDIEFSIDRAYRLSEVETEAGVSSSYFVQITNNAYNAFSDKNIDMLRMMHKNGHFIGLHYHLGGVENSLDILKKEIRHQSEVLSEMLDVPVDRFSLHRPRREHLEANIQIEGLINTYGRRFFVLTDNPQASLNVKYIADSNHQWKYIGENTLNKDYLCSFDKIQLLIHPFSWSESGAEHVENFQMLVQEKHDEFVATVEGEWKIFDMLRGKL